MKSIEGLVQALGSSTSLPSSMSEIRAADPVVGCGALRSHDEVDPGDDGLLLLGLRRWIEEETAIAYSA
eukprot:scaffold106082_cov22-Tisochrysis_lutea.AAC.1